MQIPQALKPHWAETKREKNPTDRGKLGCKRHILTDGQGLPLAITLSGANRHDCPELPYLLEALQIQQAQTQPVKRQLCLDAGYISDDSELVVELHGMVAPIRPRGEEKTEKEQGKEPRRWVVERTHSWLNRYRRLLIRWEKRSDFYWGFLCIAACLIILRRLL